MGVGVRGVVRGGLVRWDERVHGEGGVMVGVRGWWDGMF